MHLQMRKLRQQAAGATPVRVASGRGWGWGGRLGSSGRVGFLAPQSSRGRCGPAEEDSCPGPATSELTSEPVLAGSSLDLPSRAKSFTLQLPERPRGLAWPWALRGRNSELQPSQVALMNGKCDRIACPFRDTGWRKPGREGAPGVLAQGLLSHAAGARAALKGAGGAGGARSGPRSVVPGFATLVTGPQKAGRSPRESVQDTRPQDSARR